MIYGSNVTVRNCWVHNSGAAKGLDDGSGILCAVPWYNILIENNLCEYNGSYPGYDHGIYFSGTNCVVRGNVCRYNAGGGIQQYSSYGASDHNEISHNLCYSNNLLNANQEFQMYVYSATGTTNAVIGNTLAGGTSYAVNTFGGSVEFTNNIIISSYAGVLASLPSVVVGDYNLAPYQLAMNGAHDVISPAPNFADPATGLYWLSAASTARGAACGGQCGPVNFFNAAETWVTDIGAFQYLAAYAVDTRVLGPSVSDPDYWLVLPNSKVRNRR